MDKDIQNKIDKLIANKEFEDAKNLLIEQEKESPTDFLVKKNLGLCCVNLKDYQGAKKYFNEVVSLNDKEATSWYYLGIINEALNCLSEAKDAYLKVVTLRNEIADPYKNLSIIYMKERDLKNALKYAQKASELNPNDYQPYYIMSSILIAQNCPEKVVELLKKGLEIKPDHSNMLANIGCAYTELKEYDVALSYLNKAIELDANNSIAYNGLTNVYIAKEDFKNACITAKKVYELEPVEAFLTTYAMCAMKAEEYKQAVDCYKTLMVMHPDKQFLKVNLATALMKSGDAKTAEVIFYQLYKSNPKSESLGMKLVECCKNTGNLSLALSVLKKLISIGNISVEVHYDYAILCATMEQYDVALEELKKVVKLDPKNAIAHKDIAVIYLMQNLLDYAGEEFEIAYKLDKNSFSIVLEYANYFNQIQKFEESNKMYKKALKLSNYENDEVYLYSAINLIQMNELEKAYEYLMKAYKNMPEKFDVLANLTKVLFYMGKFEDSKNFAIKALELQQDSETKNVLATDYMALKNYESALQLYLELYELNSSNITIMQSLSKCYYELKQYDEALIIAKKILSFLPESEEAKNIVDKINKKKENK